MVLRGEGAIWETKLHMLFQKCLETTQVSPGVMLEKSKPPGKIHKVGLESISSIYGKDTGVVLWTYYARDPVF